MSHLHRFSLKIRGIITSRQKYGGSPSEKLEGFYSEDIEIVDGLIEKKKGNPCIQDTPGSLDQCRKTRTGHCMQPSGRGW